MSDSNPDYWDYGTARYIQELKAAIKEQREITARLYIADEKARATGSDAEYAITNEDYLYSWEYLNELIQELMTLEPETPKVLSFKIARAA